MLFRSLTVAVPPFNFTYFIIHYFMYAFFYCIYSRCSLEGARKTSPVIRLRDVPTFPAAKKINIYSPQKKSFKYVTFFPIKVAFITPAAPSQINHPQSSHTKQILSTKSNYFTRNFGVTQTPTPSRNLPISDSKPRHFDIPH